MKSRSSFIVTVIILIVIMIIQIIVFGIRNSKKGKMYYDSNYVSEVDIKVSKITPENTDKLYATYNETISKDQFERIVYNTIFKYIPQINQEISSEMSAAEIDQFYNQNSDTINKM